MPLHPYAAIAWTAAAFAAALSTRNPVYLTILLSATLAVAHRLPARPGGNGRSFRIFGGLLLTATLLALPFHVLTSRFGSHVLFTLPSHWPLIGGPATAEAAVYGLCTALQLAVMLAVFLTLNAALPASDLLRSAPAILFEAGAVGAIAVNFVPKLAANLRTVREAQAARGNASPSLLMRLRAVPALLTISLEQCIALAESMESRGFGYASDRASGVKRTRYRSYALTPSNGFILICSIASGLLLISFRFLSPDLFLYDPYAAGLAPTIDPLIATLFALPAHAAFAGRRDPI